MSSLDTLLAAARTHQADGRFADAEAAYRRALERAPGRPSLLHNLGVTLAAQARPLDALALFDQAIALEPNYAAAHYNRGVALQKLGRSRDAISALSRSAQLDPGHYDTHRALGFLWLAEGERDRSLDHFARTYELRRGEDRDGSALASLVYASAGKLRHDAAQLRYIASTRRDGRSFELQARTYDLVAADLPEQITRLSPEQLDMLGESYNTAFHIRAAPAVVSGSINPELDRGRIAAAFEPGAVAATWCDDILTPPALERLRRYLLESTIWHDFSHIGGFVATYLEDGLACPLVLQIADELRRALPEVLGAHPLSQAWAFKAFEQSASVAAHADDAAVSVNLWLAPDEANLDIGGGGLVVCCAAPPPDWEIRGYEADEARIEAFMQDHTAQNIVVPHGQNRAVIFDARLFHKSAAPRFAPGYANHRINLTLLYGHGR